MKTNQSTGPIVDDIHGIREEIAREAGYDLRTLVDRLQVSPKRHGDRLVIHPPQGIEK